MRKKMIRFAVICSLMLGAAYSYLPQAGIVHAGEDWKEEFGDICSKTDDSMTLPNEELKRLIERCDALKPRIERLDESTAKVYLKRLQMCKDLFVYVLESKSR